MTIKHGSLFSGIGGFDLAAEWMGWENVFHCEWNSFGQKVLNYYWPNAESFTDITKTDFKKYANKIDILTGGFPCQPFSLAGKRQGQDDDRYLWHEMLRAIQEIKPTLVVAENVYGITNIDGGLVFEQVCLDLEAEGYEVQPFIIPACAKDAPHRRDRVWFIAYSNSIGKGTGFGQIQESDEEVSERNDNAKFSDPSNRTTSDSESEGGGGVRNESEKERTQGGNELFGKQYTISDWQHFPTQSPIRGGDDGFSSKLVGITVSKHRNESIKAYGNAIVPQIAYEIFKQLNQLIL